MKQIILLGIITLSIFSCNQPAENKTESENTVELAKHDFDWLLGKWIRVNEKDNKQTYERWKKKSDTEYIGLGYTMQNKDTIWREDVKLLKINKGWSFNVTGTGEMNSTDFKLIEIDKEKFSCENLANEFPKLIIYQIKGDSLHAKISGGDMEVVFDFVKEK